MNSSIPSFLLLFLLSILSLSSCRERETGAAVEPIRLGTEDLQSVTLHKLSTHTILLEGGTGKYTASVATSRIAGVSVSKDTLRVTGYLEGETYATILSGDLRRRVPIHVVVPPLSTNMEEVRLYPRDESRFISLHGGGDRARLVIDDPEEAISARWQAKSGILEVDAYHEGVAVVHLYSEDGTEKSVTIRVRCNGETDGVGLYSTTSRSLYYQMKSALTAQRGGRSFTIYDSAQPYSAKRAFTVSPLPKSPTVGAWLEVTIKLNRASEFDNTKVREGRHRVIVEQVDSSAGLVTLRGKGYKMVIPYVK